MSTNQSTNNNDSTSIIVNNDPPAVRRSGRKNTTNRYSSKTNEIRSTIDRLSNERAGSSTRGSQSGMRKLSSTTTNEFSLAQMTDQSMKNINAYSSSTSALETIPTTTTVVEDIVMHEEDDEEDVVMDEEDEQHEVVSEPGVPKTKEFTFSEYIAQSMLNINDSVASDKKQDFIFDRLVVGNDKAYKLDENNEPNCNGRAVVHNRLFAGGDNRDANTSTVGIVSITQISTGKHLGELFGYSECLNLIGGCAAGENSIKKKFEALVKGEIDFFELKDFRMTQHDKENRPADIPTDDQLAKINAIKTQYNPNEANQTTHSNGRVAATTAITNTFHNNVQGRPLEGTSLQIITAPSLSSLIHTLKCIHNAMGGRGSETVCQAMKSVPPGGSLAWRGGITIEYFDEKKHGKYVDDTGGISMRGNKVESSGNRQPTAKRRKRGKHGHRYRK